MGFFSKKEQVNFTDGRRSPWKGIVRSIGELIQIAALVTAIVVPIRYFLIQPFYVKGASMEPNFYDKEYLIIDELTYRFRDPKRGEISVFRYPNDPSQFFIKRIIGLPGDTVHVKGGKVLVMPAGSHTETSLDEIAYLASDVFTAGDKTVTLGTDEYFVMGDNRGASLDSRIFGDVPRKNIVGRVMLRGWPFSKVTWFETPVYEL
jgi:signal peptidase I